MKYVSIDIETLGLNPDKCDTIEIGAVIDDLSGNQSVWELPAFHCYVTRDDNMYSGDAFAMSMHSTILKRIAKREEGYSYVPHDMVDKVFADWLDENGIEGKIVVAGKNFAGFDLRFLRRLGFGEKVKMDHRNLDPGSMFFDPSKDTVPPSLGECLRRSGIEKEVQHTAVEDAIDVVQCIRYHHGRKTS